MVYVDKEMVLYPQEVAQQPGSLCMRFWLIPCIAIAKLARAPYIGSGSVLAEAIHSFSYTCNQVLLFIGLPELADECFNSKQIREAC